MTADLDTRPVAATLVADAPTALRRRRRTTPLLREFRPDIQGLRAVAVLLVVLYHAGVPGITGGYVGVDVFFVISGFLITGKLVREAAANGRISFLSFYAGRIRRLLPAAAVVVLATLGAARLWGSVFQIRSVGWDAVLTAVYGINYRLAENGVNYQQADGPESPLQHFWSLAVEEQFYVVWPPLVGLCVVLARRRFGWLLTVVLVAGCTFSLFLSVTVTGTNAPMAYFSIQTRAWELGAGALLALVGGRLTRVPTWLSAPASWAGLAAIVWSAFAYTDETPFPGTAALVPVLGAVAVIAAGCAPAGRSAEVLLGLRPMQGIGKVSYAWYLWHWPMIIMVPLMFDRTFAWWEKLEIATLGLWLAVLTYWIVENPTAHSRLRRPAWLGVGLSLSTAIAVLGAVLVVTVPALVGGGAATSAVALAGPDVMAVRTAVAASTRTAAVPSNLQPSLGAAADDQPVSTKDGCHADILQVEQGSCVYGDPAGRRTVVLFGDSHAQQWLPALDAAAKQNHWRLVAWTKAACSIADYDVYTSQLQRRYTECVSWREATIKRMTAKHPDLVVVSQSDTVPAERVGNREWGDDTATTLRRLKNADIPVTYVMDTPYPGVDVPECTARHLGDVGACTSKRKLAWPYDGRHEALAESLAANGIATVEPIDWFCTANDCPAVVGNLLVYRDSSHMSTAYSAWLAPMLAPLFATT
jgi:peptidoglycan/LPS O-acetylase OafA/YrhL